MFKIIKISIASLFIFSGFLIQQSFAQELQLDNDSVRIYLGDNILNAEILNDSPSENPSNINIFLVNMENSPPTLENVGSVNWSTSTISLNITPNDPTYGDYSRLLFSYFENGDSGSTLSKEFNIADILNNGNSPPLTQNPNNPSNQGSAPVVTLDFPGWEFMPPSERLQPIPNGGGTYYPVLKSNISPRNSGDIAINRTPSSAPIFLIVENTNTALPITERFGVLQFIPGGTGSFNIDFLTATNVNVPDIPTTGYLNPGETYAVFLSPDFVQGFEPIILPQTRIVFTVPSTVSNQNNIVSNIIATPKQQGGTRYYEITGTITAPTSTPSDATLNFVIRAPGATSGQVLARVPYVSGPLPTIPGNQGLINFSSLAPGNYQLSINSSVDNQEIQNPINLPPMTANPSGTGSTAINNTQIFTSEQLGLLGGGIVPDCGYDLGSDGNGRMCGFTDIITLIQKAIEYIFILTVPIVAIVFAYAGYLYLTSGENPEKRKTAKNAMLKVVIGIVVVMSAWLIVTLIVSTLGVTSTATQFLGV